MVDNKKIKLP